MMSGKEGIWMKKNAEYMLEHAGLCRAADRLEPQMFDEYGVQRGLRDKNGNGVVAGLTNISRIESFKMEDGKKIPCEGKLWYRGYDCIELVNGFRGDHFGFEEVAYLLLFGKLPNRDELKHFNDILASSRTLPTNFTRDVIMKAPSSDIMNSLTRSVLTLASYDKNCSDTSIENVLRQCLGLIAVFPMLAVYGYHAYNHYSNDESMYIHRPQKKLSTAENILMMLREDRKYTELEAKILDMALVLHMDHGGGNNSTFTTHVVTSSGTDTYSTIAAAMASLKGPKHGGANIKVTQMFEDMKSVLTDWSDDDQIRAYLEALLDKQAFDKKGLIYGMGHAVYSVSDPRAEIFKRFVKQLAVEKGHEAEYALYEKVEHMAPEIIGEKRKMYKGVNANVDFYSGLVYSMLDLPPALYTPIFAAARIVGWSAHRLEELKNVDKIIRPAYKPLAPYREYIKLDDR